MDLIVKANENEGAIFSFRAPARSILAAARTSADTEVRNVAEATIGRLARKGYDFRDSYEGKASPFGEAENSWLAGTAAWTFVGATRNFRGVEYQIEVKNPNGI